MSSLFSKFQPARFLIPVVHESLEDFKVHHLEELQMANLENIPLPFICRIPRSIFLQLPWKYGRKNVWKLD